MSIIVDAFIRDLKRIPREGPDEYLQLKRIRALLRLVGDPEQSLRGVHVLGTTGKGSVAAMLEAAFRASGYRTGLFTGPHLVRVNERIRINGKIISDRLLEFWAEMIWPHLRTVEMQVGTRPTFFEGMTAIAALAFRAAACDVCIVEAGLGGKRDATLPFSFPLKVITNVGLDHQRRLGRLLTAIAQEKAGMIAPDDTVVTGAVGRPRAVIEHVARQKKARLVFADQEMPCGDVSVDWQGTDVRFHNKRCPRLTTNLIGTHHADNLSTAWTTLMAFERQGFTIKESAARRGLRSVCWPGRFQVLSSRPRIVLDGAHNGPSIRAVIATLDALAVPPERLVVLFMAKRRKVIEAPLQRLARRSGTILFPEPLDRSFWSSRDLRKICRSGRAAPPWPEALRQAKKEAGPGGVVLITGSLYYVGEVLAAQARTRYALLGLSRRV